MLDKIVSGGQTGADRAALDFAIKHKIPHGGWVPKGKMVLILSIPLMAEEILLGINNGRSAYLIYSQLDELRFGLDLDDVRSFLLRYRAEFDFIKRWQDEIVEATKGSGFLQTPL